MKARYIIAAALLSFLLSLLAHAPAASLYGWTVGADTGLPVQLYGVSGTLLSGTASQLSRGNQVVVRDVRWRLKPTDLLMARATYALAAGGPPLLLEGRAGIGLGGAVRLHDTRASGKLRALAAIAGFPFVPLDGDIGVELASLVLVDQRPRSAEGRIQVLGLSWALGREPVVLGDFEAQVDSTDDGIAVSVSTLEGAVEVNGNARLSSEGAYEVDLQLRAVPDAPPMVANLLRSLGPADARGYHRLRQQGSLQPAQPPSDGPAPPSAVTGNRASPATPAPQSPPPAHHMMPPT